METRSRATFKSDELELTPVQPLLLYETGSQDTESATKQLSEAEVGISRSQPSCGLDFSEPRQKGANVQSADVSVTLDSNLPGVSTRRTSVARLGAPFRVEANAGSITRSTNVVSELSTSNIRQVNFPGSLPLTTADLKTAEPLIERATTTANVASAEPLKVTVVEAPKLDLTEFDGSPENFASFFAQVT